MNLLVEQPYNTIYNCSTVHPSHPINPNKIELGYSVPTLPDKWPGTVPLSQSVPDLILQLPDIMDGQTDLKKRWPSGP